MLLHMFACADPFDMMQNTNSIWVNICKFIYYIAYINIIYTHTHIYYVPINTYIKICVLQKLQAAFSHMCIYIK